jgi:general secretion pathway protein I
MIRRCPAGEERRFGPAGFTLIEVLVAMAILAIAFTAVLRANLQVQDSILTARRETAATILASGLLARIEAQGPQRWSRYRGREEQAGLVLSWRVRISGTPAEALRRVVIEVREREGGEVLARREAFLREGSGQ